MPKSKRSTTKPKKQPRRTRSQGEKFQSLTGGELHGRGGESLPSREATLVGRERDEGAGGAARSQRRAAKDQVIEIEYERGPGSRFQIEGRGGVPRSKRSKKGD